MNDKNGAYSDIDVESLDMELHPKLKDVQWFNITLEKGDCIFIPYRLVVQT